MTLSLLYEQLTQFSLHNLSIISFGIIAALLVLYGDAILKVQKKLFKRFHFILRLSAFIIVAGLGFSLLAFWSETFLTQLLLSLPRDWLVPSILGVYFILGSIAEAKRFI